MRDARFKKTLKQGRSKGNALTKEVKGRAPAVSKELRNKGADLSKEIAKQYQKMDMSWARKAPAGLVRSGIAAGVLAPLMYLYVRRRVSGRELLGDEMTDPVIFVANHCSHLDTPTILRAMPREWRKRTAVAAAADYFYKSRVRAAGAALVFNTIPLGRQGGGMKTGAMDHVDTMIADGWNLLLFPEGTRSRDGEIGNVRSGAAVIAAQHGLNIVPIWVGGTHEAMPPGQNWPKRRRGRFGISRPVKIEVRFGPPIPPHDTSERKEVMAQVRAFWEREGKPEGPEPAPTAHDVLLMHEALRAKELNGSLDIVIPIDEAR
jgi:1-acyl-sn-glycerol-3-phosphate acyltransferase